jgi:hypothetical protein
MKSRRKETEEKKLKKRKEDAKEQVRSRSGQKEIKKK